MWEDGLRRARGESGTDEDDERLSVRDKAVREEGIAMEGEWVARLTMSVSLRQTRQCKMRAYSGQEERVAPMRMMRDCP